MPTTEFKNKIGDKQYQLSNHLGNVLTTISDYKIHVKETDYWISLDGTTDYVTTAGTFNYGLTNEVTIEAWVKTTDNTNPVIIASNYDPASDKGVHLMLTTGIPRLQGRNGNSASSITPVTGVSAINDDEWHHVVGTVEDDHWKLYVDGVLVSELTPTYVSGDFSGSRKFRVGTAIHNTTYDLQGEVREVSMWKRAKSANEIAVSVFTEYTGTETDIVQYWKLNDNASPAASSVSGAPSGTLTGNVSWESLEQEYFLADVLSATDYSSFGSPLPGRTFVASGGEYDFGFNGMLKDDELKGDGNSYDFGARILDPRLGRWLSVDPKASEYPGWSTYKAFRNCPLVFIDPNGETEYVAVTFKRKDGSELQIKKTVSTKIMTDGVPYMTGSACPVNVNNFYDYTTNYVYVEQEDGSWIMQKPVVELDKSEIKDSDVVWFESYEKGYTKEVVPGSDDGGGIEFTSKDGQGGAPKAKNADGKSEDADALISALGGLTIKGMTKPNGKVSAEEVTEVIGRIKGMGDHIENVFGGGEPVTTKPVKYSTGDVNNEQPGDTTTTINENNGDTIKIDVVTPDKNPGGHNIKKRIFTNSKYPDY